MLALIASERAADRVADEGAVDEDPRAHFGIARIEAQLDALATQLAVHLEAAAAELDRSVRADPPWGAVREDVAEVRFDRERPQVTVGELGEEMLLWRALGRRVDAPVIVAGRLRHPPCSAHANY
jgi:hypothetical protein